MGIVVGLSLVTLVREVCAMGNGLSLVTITEDCGAMDKTLLLTDPMGGKVNTLLLTTVGVTRSMMLSSKAGCSFGVASPN